MENRILVTGFGPFAKAADNPSAILAEACGAENRVLEVSWKAVDDWLDCSEADEFDILLHLGFAERPHMTPELFARNAYGSLADVRGETRSGEVQPDGPLLLESTLWTPTIVSGVLMDDRVQVSEDAGTYLCNYISYRSIQRFPKKRVGFLHVPGFERIGQAAQLEVLTALLKRLALE